MADRVKQSDPKEAVGVARAPVSTVPAPVIAEVGVAMMEGARKYGRHNYRVTGARASVYYDAALRHLMAWWEGEDLDPDSGLPHIAKAIAGLTVLRDCERLGQMVDDRPPPHDPAWIAGLNRAAAGILERYSAAAEPCTKED